MRFSEFKFLKEAAEQNKFYTIGDSHAAQVAIVGGKDWVNLAVGGASSKGSHPIIQQMLGNISKIPKGSVVLVSLGANDTANAMTAGKPSRTPSSIAADVASVVEKVKAQGPSKVVFLLFPNGPGRGSKDAKFYGGEFQDQVRSAIKNAIGDVEIIDINGKPLYDGIHAGNSTYKEVAGQVVTKYKPSSQVSGKPLSTIAQAPEKVADKKAAETTDLKAGPPFPPEQFARVKAMQTKLKDIGYGLGSTGVDGKFGPRTSAALAAFIKDYNLQGKSNLFDAGLAKALDDVISGAIQRVQKPTQVNTRTAPQQTSAGKTLVGGVKNPGAALKEPEFMKKLQQVAERLGVEQEVLLKVMKFESNLDPQAVNSMSKATGLIQFMPDTATGLGTSVEELYNMTATDQLNFVEKYYKRAGVKPGATVGDLYMLTFMPAAANKPDDFVIGNRNGGRVFNLDAGKVYAQNKGFDKDNDGIFTKADIINTVNQRFA